MTRSDPVILDFERILKQEILIISLWKKCQICKVPRGKGFWPRVGILKTLYYAYF